MPSLTSADLPLYVNLVISSAKLDCRRKAEDEETKASDPTAMTAAMMKMRMLDYVSALTSVGGGGAGRWGADIVSFFRSFLSSSAKNSC